MKNKGKVPHFIKSFIGVCSPNFEENQGVLQNLRSVSTEKERHQLIPDAKSCSTCGVKFEDLAEQRQHFKMDWHR